jgi:hypothetical protein
MKHFKFFSAAFLAGIAFLFSGCDEEKINVTAESASQVDQLSRVRASVDRIRADNKLNPDGPAKQSVELHASVAQAGLPEAKPDDAENAAKISSLVFAGKIEEATTRAVKAESEVARLLELADAERQQSAEKIRAVIAEAEMRVKQEAYLAVVKVFSVIGGTVLLAGIGMCVLSTWKRLGAALIVAGPVIGGSGLLWGQRWFMLTMGIGVLLAGVALGIWWGISAYEKISAARKSSVTGFETMQHGG